MISRVNTLFMEHVNVYVYLCMLCMGCGLADADEALPRNAIKRIPGLNYLL